MLNKLIFFPASGRISGDKGGAENDAAKHFEE